MPSLPAEQTFVNTGFMGLGLPPSGMRIRMEKGCRPVNQK
jgi:hypothetical protein